MTARAAMAQSIRLKCRGVECRVQVDIGRGFSLETVDRFADISRMREGLPCSLYALAATIYQHWPKEGKCPEYGTPKEYPFPPARSIGSLLKLAEVLDLFPPLGQAEPQGEDPTPFAEEGSPW